MMGAHYKPLTYRRWNIYFIYPPIPTRDFDWLATHPSYDADVDGDNGMKVMAASYQALLDEIDAFEADLLADLEVGASVDLDAAERIEREAKEHLASLSPERRQQLLKEWCDA